MVNNEADRCFSLVEFRSSSCMAKMTFLQEEKTNTSDDTEDTGERREPEKGSVIFTTCLQLCPKQSRFESPFFMADSNQIHRKQR